MFSIKTWHSGNYYLEIQYKGKWFADTSIGWWWSSRSIGVKRMYYDGPHLAIWFGPINFYLQCSRMRIENYL